MYRIALAVVIIVDLVVFFPYRKKIKLINLLMVGFMTYIAFNVRQTPDINNYMIRYNMDYAGHEYGFILLARFFRNHGATYFEFQNCYLLVAISTISYGLIRLTDNRTFIYIFYFFFPFLLNLVQLRNFMVLAFLVLAIGVSYGNENNIIKRIGWCVLCGLAATQHIVAIAYIPFVFVWDNKKALKFIIGGSLGVTLLLLITPDRMVAIISNFINLVADDTRASIYGVRATQFGIIVMVLESVAMILIAKYSSIFIDEYNQLLDKMGSTKYIETSHFEFVVNLLYYSSIFWPFYFLNGNFTRLMQNELLIVYMVIATVMRYALNITQLSERNVKMSNMLIGIFLFFIPLYAINLSTLWNGLYESVVVPVLYDNLF